MHFFVIGRSEQGRHSQPDGLLSFQHPRDSYIPQTSLAQQEGIPHFPHRWAVQAEHQAWAQEATKRHLLVVKARVHLQHRGPVAAAFCSVATISNGGILFALENKKNGAFAE